MDPRIKKLEAEIENYEKAIAKRKKEIKHFQGIIKNTKRKLTALKKPAPKKKTKSKAKAKTKKSET
jgi:chromosome segregation ATPase